MLPQRLILVRHGESEGNLIVHKTRDDDDSLYDPKMKDAHTVSWRLSKTGVEQAQQAGEWIKENTFMKDACPWNEDLVFKRFYVSDYIRAIETAYELNLQNPHWQVTSEVRERMYGDIDFLYKKKEFDSEFEKNLKQREATNYHWLPENGEAIATVRERASNFAHRILDSSFNSDALIVTHGEFIWAMRIAFDEITPLEYETLHTEKPIYNCQVTEFSHLIGDQGYSKVRHYVPSAPDYHNWEYQDINFDRVYSNHGLSEIIKSYPRLITYQ
jgi:broad specificity phosphatase PhoE